MDYQEATKHAQAFFKTYPKIDTFHITTDGQVFGQEHHAQSHAKSLSDKPVVHTVHRGGNAKSEKPDEVKSVKEVIPTHKAVSPDILKEAAEKKAASIQKAKETKAKNAAAKAK